MKAPRLARSNPGQTLDAKASFDAKTSFDDLRSPDGRQRLREQLSSQFPDSYTNPLKGSPSATEMGGRDWLQVGQNVAAKSSSSSVDSTSNGLKRLPEQQAAIDVEQAISLLTELKKTATPEQLVALHKALLPTRDSIISTAGSTAGQRTSLIRQKSMLPPGLATRGGASDDLLKRQEDVEPVVRKKKSSPSDGHQRLQSKSSLAALDLAEDTVNPLSTQRAVTPNDQQYFGAYRPGTLRITNGAASPEPSLRPRTSGDQAATAGASSETLAGRDRAGSLAEAVSQWRPVGDAALDSTKQLAQTSNERTARSTLPSSNPRDPSQSRQYRSQRSQEPLQSNTPLARSREPSLSRVPIHVETKASKQCLSASRQASMDTLLRRSIDSITVRRSIDDGRVSPIDAPRFAQRWSHRASQISHEYMTDCEVPVSPFEDKQTALAFAQRLSTVYDREDAENTASETPEAALSKLEGNSPETNPKSSPKSLGERPEERRGVWATADGLNNATRPPLTSHYTEPRPMPTKGDSGYVSDASRRSMQRQLSHDPAIEHTESPVTFEHAETGYKEIVHRPSSKTDDIQSLYTLEQILKMPSVFSAPSTPPRPDAARKHSSLLKLTGLRKSSFAASKTILDAHSSADSLPLPNDHGGSSPVEPKSVKPSKKLQKRMPEDLRKQRKEQRDKAKQSSLSLEPQDPDAMDMPNDLSELASSPVSVSELATASTTVLPASPLAARGESIPAGPSELMGDSQHPAELHTDESATAPKPGLSRRESKKRWRRSRQNTVTGTDTEDQAESKSRRSFSLGRKRSKSKRRSGSLTPKRKSREVPKVPSIATLSATWNENGSQESLPLYSDYGSVARTLGTNPYDISTGMFKKRNSSGPVLDELQSPHQISTSFSRATTGGLQGMDASMASELARMKSRDVAMQKSEVVFDLPRIATPKTRSQTDIARSRNTMPNAIIIEQRSPGWHAKPIFQKSSFDSLDTASRQRPHSVAESIPSLPEMPVDAEARSAKAAEYLTKRSRQTLAESPSPASSPDPSSADNLGFSNESVADAVAKAVEARRAKHAERVKQGQKEDRPRPAGPRMNSNASSSSGKVSLQIHGVDERPYSDASASILIGVGSERGDEEDRPVTSPAEIDGPELTVWERQAQMWRGKHASVGKSLGRPGENDTAVDDEHSAAPLAAEAPRHATPSAPKSLPSARGRRQSASEQANAYRDLIGSENESYEEAPRPNGASTQDTSTATARSSIDTVVVIEHAIPAKAYQATLVQRERSHGGRVRTPSGSYHPYTPDHAQQAERSRAGSLAQLEGKDLRSTQSLEIQQRNHHKQNDTLDPTLGRYDRTLSPVPASEAGSIHETPERKVNGTQRDPIIDRYGGGLQYGYERGVGLQGSSGLRSSVIASKARSGNRFSEHYGLDLGDVPVFLRRAG